MPTATKASRASRILVALGLAIIATLANVGSANAQTPTVVGVELVNQVRTGRTSFDYTYRIRVQNGATPLANARAVATSNVATTVVIKGTVALGDLAANALVTSQDTFTIRQDRQAAYSPSTITWQVLGDTTTPVARALATLEASGQLPVLDRSALLLGTDANGNGVRDDIDTYIGRLPDTTVQKGALRQVAKAVADAMQAAVGNASGSALKDVDITIARAVRCIWSRYDASVASTKFSAIEKLMANTRSRFDAYDLFNVRMSGTSGRLPSGDTCDTP